MDGEKIDMEQKIEDLKQFEDAVKNGDLPSAAGKIHKMLTDTFPLNIAITGVSGVGKSSFVNAIRCLGDEDEESAPTGVVETTMEPKSYPHHQFPNVEFWDLPGIGTMNFKPDEYLEKVKFDSYDFFIILSSDRFTAQDVQLAKQIQTTAKKFYFVRSKIDISMENESRKKAFNKDETLEKIRNNCIKGLEDNGVKSPKVFLVTSRNMKHYDYPALQETMENEIPKHKQHALLMALPNVSLKVHQKKKESFESRLWKVAIASGTIAAIPIPGLSFAADIALIVTEVKKYYNAFGLDRKSLQALAVSSGVPLNELKEVLKSPLSKGITKDVLVKLLTKSVGGVAMVAEQAFNFLPFVGTLIASSISFTTTYCMLKSCLKELSDDAHNVLVKALEASSNY